MELPKCQVRLGIAQPTGKSSTRETALRHVLIVDDDTTALAYMTAKMEQAGFQVTALSRGSEVIAAVEELAPDLVLLDLEMPDMHGLEVLRRIKEDGNTRSTSVVVLSAHHSEANVTLAKSLGATDFIIKPFLAGDFASHLRKIL